MSRVGNNSTEPGSTISVHRVRIFLASPGDVAEERKLTQEAIGKLRNEFRYKDCIRFETVVWD